MKIFLRFLSVTCICCLFLVFSGCEDPKESERQEDEQKKIAQQSTFQDDRQKVPKNDPEIPSHVLKSGEILSVRLFYENPKNETERIYKVQLNNPRNSWYDYVEWTNSPSEYGGVKFDDFPFGSENFNKQITESYYSDKEAINGQYNLTIAGNSGYWSTHSLTWKDGEWVNNRPTLVFSVP